MIDEFGSSCGEFVTDGFEAEEAESLTVANAEDHLEVERFPVRVWRGSGPPPWLSSEQVAAVKAAALEAKAQAEAENPIFGFGCV